MFFEHVYRRGRKYPAKDLLVETLEDILSRMKVRILGNAM